MPGSTTEADGSEVRTNATTTMPTMPTVWLTSSNASSGCRRLSDPPMKSANPQNREAQSARTIAIGGG